MATPGMAAADAFEGQPPSPGGTMQLQGFDGVLRAAGPVAAAGRKHHAPAALVAANGQGQRTSERAGGRFHARLRLERDPAGEVRKSFRRLAASASKRSASARNWRLMSAKDGWEAARAGMPALPDGTASRAGVPVCMPFCVPAWVVVWIAACGMTGAWAFRAAFQTAFRACRRIWARAYWLLAARLPRGWALRRKRQTRLPDCSSAASGASRHASRSTRLTVLRRMAARTRRLGTLSCRESVRERGLTGGTVPVSSRNCPDRRRVLPPVRRGRDALAVAAPGWPWFCEVRSCRDEVSGEEGTSFGDCRQGLFMRRLSCTSCTRGGDFAGANASMTHAGSKVPGEDRKSPAPNENGPCRSMRGAASGGCRCSDGQTVTAFGTTGAQHGTATTGFLANQKTMGSFTTADGGLIGALHGEYVKKSRDSPQKLGCRGRDFPKTLYLTGKDGLLSIATPHWQAFSSLPGFCSPVLDEASCTPTDAACCRGTGSRFHPCTPDGCSPPPASANFSGRRDAAMSVERHRRAQSAPSDSICIIRTGYPQPQPERPVDRCSEPVDKLEFCSLWRVPDVLRHAVWSRVCGPSRPVRWADRLRHQVLNCLQNAPFTPLNGRILQQPASEARYLSRPRHGRSLQQSGSHCPQIVTWAPCPEPVDNHVSNRPL